MIKKQRSYHNMKKTQLSEEDREDRISALPDSLILHILSYLPMKAVVKTGVLSTRWDHLWTQVSSLQYSGRWPHAKYSERKFEGFVNFVNHTISLHQIIPIGEFSLEFPLVGEESGKGVSRKVQKMSSVLASHVDRWIRFAVQKKAKKIYIEFSPPGGDNAFSPPESDDEDVLPSNAPYKLPHHLCSNDSFEKLVLRYCVFKPVKQISWNSLVVLKLYYMELSDEVIQNIVSGSSLLEKIYLRNCSGITNLNITSERLHTLQVSELRITAPYVKTLHLRGDLSGFDLINMSSLVTAHFYPCLQIMDEPQQIMLSTLLAGLGQAENLTVSAKCLQVFAMLEIQNRHLLPLNCKILSLPTRRTKWEIAGLVALLKASTNLQKLILLHWDEEERIDVGDEFLKKHDFDEANYWSSLTQFPSLTSIKTLKTYDFRGKSSETTLIEFLYKNAQVLQTIEIICHKDDDDDSEDELLGCNITGKISQKLLSFRRASPDAIVLFS